MRSFLMLFTLFTILIGNTFAEPIVKYNVHVLQNATQAQCLAARNGDAGPVSEQAYSSIGEYNGSSGPGVRSCSGCAVDPQSQDCVCRTCYYYFN